MFKNETHNHPTEIEPFGGAATCLGGAIRDPLSGRSLRLSGDARHRLRRPDGARLTETLPGKLPQRKIDHHRGGGLLLLRQPDRPGHRASWTRSTTTATSPSAWRSARSSARRPRTTCAARRPRPGDVVILLGGTHRPRRLRRRDRLLQVATRSHSLDTCGAEVQKGNRARGAQAPAPVPRPGGHAHDQALQRLRRGRRVRGHRRAGRRTGHRPRTPCPRSTTVWTAPSWPSPNRRSAWPCVVAPEDVDAFIAAGAARKTWRPRVVATVTRRTPPDAWTGTARRSSTSSREFLNSNGARQAHRRALSAAAPSRRQRPRRFRLDANRCCRCVSRPERLLPEGAWSSALTPPSARARVLMPFGGKHQLTPAQAMAAKIPVLQGETDDLLADGLRLQPRH